MELTSAFMGVNFLAIVIAAVIQFFIGWLWYSPIMFAAPWLEDMGIRTGDMKQDGASMAKRYGSTVILFFFANWTLAAILGPGVETATAVNWGLAIAILVVGALMGVNALFDKRSFRVYLINTGYHVVCLLVAALVIGLWN